MRSDVTALRVYPVSARRPVPTRPRRSVRERVRVVRAATDRTAVAADRIVLRPPDAGFRVLVDELALRDDPLAQWRHGDREVARDEVTGLELDERRHLGGALLLRLEAPRPEDAAARRVD